MIQLFAHNKMEHAACRFFGLSDSAFQDADDMKSTGCDTCVIQGGIVEMGSFVPEPVAMSSAEAECNAVTVAVMKFLHIKFIVCEILKGDPTYNYTIPIFTDSTSSIAITSVDKDTKRTEHIESRWQYIKYTCRSARAVLYHIDNTYQLADVGTKNLSNTEAKLKLSFMEVLSPDVQKAPPITDHESEEG
jgi:hypothetical protein